MGTPGFSTCQLFRYAFEVAPNVCRFNFADAYNHLRNARRSRTRTFMNTPIIARIHVERSSGPPANTCNIDLPLRFANCVTLGAKKIKHIFFARQRQQRVLLIAWNLFVENARIAGFAERNRRISRQNIDVLCNYVAIIFSSFHDTDDDDQAYFPCFFFLVRSIKLNFPHWHWDAATRASLFID